MYFRDLKLIILATRPSRLVCSSATSDSKQTFWRLGLSNMANMATLYDWLSMNPHVQSISLLTGKGACYFKKILSNVFSIANQKHKHGNAMDILELIDGKSTLNQVIANGCQATPLSLIQC